MRKVTLHRQAWSTAILAALLLPAPGDGAQAPPAAPPAAAQPKAPAKKPFKPEELEQIVAPIALHPDELISQVLMASTYPLEVVEASRWVKANPNLKGDQLTRELEKKTWDPSVKSLIQFPQVLAMMDEKLEWTQKLGDAFLAQPKEVMAAVQKLRGKAQAQGNLKTNEQQKVVVEETVIKIESTSPEVVYVPTYNPTVVYGSWPYPTYPPYYYYPPGYAAATAAVSFGVGVAMGAAWGYAWGGCNWHGGEVDIDIDKNVNHNRNINREQYKSQQASRTGSSASKSSFQHDPQHRKGASYRDTATAQKYNRQGNQATAQTREAYRGRAEQGRQQLATTSDRSRPAGSAGSAGTRPTQSQARPSTTESRSGSAFQGSESGRSAKSQGDRGYQSRQSSASSRSSGTSRSSSSASRASSSSGSRSYGGASRGGASRGGGGRGGGGRR